MTRKKIIKKVIKLAKERAAPTVDEVDIFSKKNVESSFAPKVDDKKTFQFNRTQGMGMMPPQRQYFNSDQTLAVIEIGPDRSLGLVKEERVKYIIVSKDKPEDNFETLGHVVLGQKPDQNGIDDFINIELNENARGKNIGSKVVKGLINYSNNPQGLLVRDIQKEAKPFWEKVGVKEFTKSKEGSMEGFIPKGDTSE